MGFIESFKKKFEEGMMETDAKNVGIKILRIFKIFHYLIGSTKKQEDLYWKFVTYYGSNEDFLNGLEWLRTNGFVEKTSKNEVRLIKTVF